MPNSEFTDFLDDAARTDLAPAFERGSRPLLMVDRTGDRPGVPLQKGVRHDRPGHQYRSVLSFALSPDMGLDQSLLKGIASLEDLADAFEWRVEDASPDSVTSVLFLAARLSGVALPEDQSNRWCAVITDWEVNGVADDPDISWPALAAALAHSLLDIRTRAEEPDGPFVRAWQQVMAFAIEALRRGWDPADIPSSQQGPLLNRARAALEEERARYERKLFAQQIFQLNLPMKESRRTRLVDAILTTEEEFSGALKVLARNDRKNSPLGRGFTVLILVRPGLKEQNPGYWVTVSLDTRANVHLFDLWQELERLETEAWHKAGLKRAPFVSGEDGSRILVTVPMSEQKFHQQWYLDAQHSLIASPHQKEASDDGVDRPSQLDLDTVLEAIFRVYDPFSGLEVEDTVDATWKRLPEVISQTNESRKAILSARWSRVDPLPHPAGPAAFGGLFPLAVRVMGARTLGVSSEHAIAKAPDLEDIDLVAFGSGIAAISDGGVFLLDAGRRRPAQLDAARAVVDGLARLAHRLDSIQTEIAERAEELAEEIEKASMARSWLNHQRFCVTLTGEINRLRASLDQPLETKRAGLQPLGDAISRRWNIRSRLTELAAEVQALQSNGRAAEEARAFHAGRLAAALALALVLADALAGRVKELLLSTNSTWPPILWLKSFAWVELILFVGITCATFLLLPLALPFARRRALWRDKNGRDAKG